MRPDIRVADDVLLTPLTVELAAAYAALVIAERARLVRWLPWAADTHGADDVRAHIATIEQRRRDDLGECYAVVVGGALAGALDIHSVNRLHAVGAYGYWLAARFGGRGVMTHAVRALTPHAFGEHRLNRLEILVATQNAASRAVAERAGFTLESIMRERLYAPGGFDDCALYVQLARDMP